MSARAPASLVVEVGHASLNKRGEGICGDCVKITRTRDSTLLVVSDGLGSGVKANILATLSTEIATSMIQHGAQIEEMVETIAATLPICRIRRIAYATFTILHITNGREGYLVEYDNPPIFLLRDGKLVDLPRTERDIAGRVVRESVFDVRDGDYLVCVSDGVIHAGMGGVLPLGWRWDGVAHYLAQCAAAGPSAHTLADRIVERCRSLYDGQPGDDVTVVATRIRPVATLTVLTGPPVRQADDAGVVRRFAESPGKKVVCGGTTANVVARVLRRQIDALPLGVEDDVPPAAWLPGTGLVTEGIVTLNRAIQRLQGVDSAEDLPNRKDAATQLARAFLEADDVRLMVGGAINPMQVADVIRGQPFRWVLVDALVRELQNKGKVVDVEHF